MQEETDEHHDSDHRDSPIAAKGYAHPDALVSTEWLAAHLDDPNIRIIESDEDVLLYDTGHIPGALKVDWHTDLNDPVVRDYVDARSSSRSCCARDGIDESTTVIFYGDKNNWWAAYAFWVFQLFGFTNAKLLDGGRVKWEQEGRPLTTDVPAVATRVELHGARARRRADSRLHERRARARRREGQAGRRALARGVFTARSCTCPSIRRRARCAAGTSRARRAFPGRAPRTPTARSSPPTSSARSTSRSTA